MQFDVARPVQNIGHNRDEIFVVFYDGFIKNSTEGMIRTMLENPMGWYDHYPDLKSFENVPMKDIYDMTMFYQPKDMLESMSDGKLSDEEIEADLNEIMPTVFLALNKMTTFEITLYQILQEFYVKKCYIYKEGKFYKNEILYCQTRYANCMDKIEFVDEVNLPDFILKVHPTTIFINDPSFVFDYVANEMSDDDRFAQIYVILANYQMLQYDEKVKSFVYTKEVIDTITAIGEDAVYGVAPMFNFQMDDVVKEEVDITKVESEEENANG